MYAREDEAKLGQAFRQLNGEIAARVVDGCRYIAAIDNYAEIFGEELAGSCEHDEFA